MIFVPKKRFFLPLLTFLTAMAPMAQRHASIQKIEDVVVIDGKLSEAFWQNQDAFDAFINQWPVDSGLAKLQTHVRLAFDDQFLYVGAICYDRGTGRIIRTLKRDQENEHFGSDGFGIVLDPVNKKSNGFFFGVNAGGAQIEGLIRISDSSTEIEENWDNRWLSKVSATDSSWMVEMAIPFRTLRYNPDEANWGINFVRNDMDNNVYSSWNQVPVNLNTIDLGYTGILNWTSPPPKVKNGSVNIIPYVSGSALKDHSNGSSTVADGNIGVDAKIALNSSLNLDLTINPDFSTVDVDVQQTNLTRFSLFFPERRSFFLENSDLFTSFGLGSIQPFFSRRIGLSNGSTIPILFGARVTGNLTEKVRVGAMNVRTGSADGVNAQNFTLGTLHHRIGKRSSIKGLFVNRQAVNNQQDQTEARFNRVGALELNLLSPNGKWGGDIGMQKSFNPHDLDEEEYYSATFRHRSKRLFARASMHMVGQNFLTDAGFVPRLLNHDAARDTVVRLGFTRLSYLVVYDFYSESDKVNLHGPRFSGTYVLNEDGSINGSFDGLFYYFSFKNQSDLEVRFTLDRDNLPFDSFIAGDIPFPGANYKYRS
ncbi:MAG: DUF5916 domain-containing protein, partial [Cyclobacteriaceae bacterium]